MKEQEFNNLTYEGIEVPHFDYEEFGVQGVGKNRLPIINMDKYIDHTANEDLHTECLAGLAMSEDNFKMGMFWGALPPWEEERLHGKSWTTILQNIEQYDPTGIHRRKLHELAERGHNEDPKYHKAMYRYIYYALPAVIPWFFGLSLKDNHFFTKTSGGHYSEAAKNFPNVIDYIESLKIFKEVGRILFFCTYPGAGVACHRDAPMRNHRDHNINLFFDGGARPSFVWDEKTDTKHYLDPSAHSYGFNNRDYHGVDPEPNFRYTLRVDGTFTDEMCDELGIVDGYTWHTDYSE